MNLWFSLDLCAVQRLVANTYVGQVSRLGDTCITQQKLQSKDCYKAEDLFIEGKYWMDEWFNEISSWHEWCVDLEQLAWVRVFGLSVQA